jgi:hypothetical protein
MDIDHDGPLICITQREVEHCCRIVTSRTAEYNHLELLVSKHLYLQYEYVVLVPHHDNDDDDNNKEERCISNH